VSDILAEILDVKRGEIAAAKARRSLAALEQAATEAPAPRSLHDALHRPAGAPVRAIAEVKRASPSAGPIRPGADVPAIAREYEAAGAAAISVLTDERFFDGRLAFLTAARAAVGVPVLRKDFLIDPYQVVEARAAGADAVLLIAAALPGAALEELLAASRAWQMDALVEVHDAVEADQAAAAGARVIGVNHRDLKTFSIDMGLTARLAPRMPAGAVLVAESGIATADDVRELGRAGAHAILVGERLMRAESPGQALSRLLEGAAPG
jgi:indole-3-glycerol phosphate synthase